MTAPETTQPKAPPLRPSPFLRANDMAVRYGVSVRTIHEWTRLREIPFRRLPGTRACLFLEKELLAWESGTPLEVVERDRGVFVRPYTSSQSIKR